MAHPDYRSLAAQARGEADAATLDNVRQRQLRSEAAFLAMARRQDLADANRARREAAAEAEADASEARADAAAATHDA
ncbi:hypothetical protein [Sphingobium mellinum]|uniref:hypothetical protein n=1 Tax=Sphingobium mellinum TaxID=1387166 RepID=UPI0030EE0363